MSKLSKSTPSAVASTPLDKAKAAWLRMLQMLPGLNFLKATSIVKQYPTLESLMVEYDGVEGEQEGEVMLADKFGGGRREERLSEKVYRALRGEEGGDLV